MYALLEFLRGKRKEYAVIPIIWLYNDNKGCYWPRVKPEEFTRLVREKSPYDKRWPEYKVHRVVKSSDAYDSLQQELTDILEQSTTDSGNSAAQIAIIGDEPSHEQEIVSESDGTPKTTRKRKSKVKTQKRKHKTQKRENKKSRTTKSRSPKKKQPSSSLSSPTSDSDNTETHSVHDETEFEISSGKSVTKPNRETPPDIFQPRSTTGPKIINITNMESIDSHLGDGSSSRFPALHRNITGMESLLSSPKHVLPSKSPASLKNMDNTESLAPCSKYTSPPGSLTSPRSITNMELFEPYSEYATSPKSSSTCRSIINKEPLASYSQYAFLPESPATSKSITYTKSPALSSKYASPPRSPNTLRSTINTEPLASHSKSAPPPGSSATPRSIIGKGAHDFSLTQSPSSSRPHKFGNLSQEYFQTEVLTRLQVMDSELSQINTSLNQLSRCAQFGNIQAAVQPEGFPTMPLETIEDFRSFDLLLKIEIYDTYFTNRLAAIRGVNVRQGVMNALKFALSNKVAMEYNWAGRDKKQPFQVTEMARVITAAAKIRFSESPDATDIQISAAIKDWLKQAKHRHACQEKRHT